MYDYMPQPIFSENHSKKITQTNSSYTLYLLIILSSRFTGKHLQTRLKTTFCIINYIN